NFSGSDTIRSLYIDGVAQPVGVYGNGQTGLITGSGSLNVTTAPSPGVAGDFNGNGVVDMADYVLWRDGGPLQNEISDTGVVTAQDYLDWRANFGNTHGSGSGSSLGQSSAVPEPTATCLLLAGVVMGLVNSR